jgi:23S rRNA (adenine2503-C2)-methyltransferase
MNLSSISPQAAQAHAENIYDLDFSELSELLASWGEPAYRSTQVWQGLYRQLIDSPDQLTSIPKSTREKLISKFGTAQPENPLTFSHLTQYFQQISKDSDTHKILFKLSDGKVIETVLMKYNQRRTVCVSTQSGCAMGCSFCATGQMGFLRSLSSGEICEQILFFARKLALTGEKLSNIVLMGMGEPFHNYEATLAAIDRLNHPQGLNFGARRFTISTVGLVPMIRKFTSEKRQINLAVSLHAAEDELRSTMLPINKRYPLDALFAACLDYVKTTKRRITFEWALIDGVNDSPEQARKLAQRLQMFKTGDTVLCHVNVIPLNPTKKFAGKAAKAIHVQSFKKELENYQIPCTVRVRRGIEIQAGCGQLAGETLTSTRPIR